MATPNLGGFEEGDSSPFLATAGTFSIQTSVVRTGTYGLRVNPTTTASGSVRVSGYSSAQIATANAMSVADLRVRFYFRYATKPSSNDEEIFKTQDTASADKFYLRLNSAGNLAAYDSTNTVITTGSTVLSANTWYMIEVLVGTGASATWEVKIDGVSEITTGTANLGTTNNGSFFFGKTTNRNGNTVDFYYDDYRASTSAYPGAGEVKMLVPNANGTYQTATIGAGGGNHYENVDEVPNDGATTYLQTDLVVNDAETEAMQDTGTVGITGTVNAVKLGCIVRRQAAGAACRLRLRSGSTDSDAGLNATPSSTFGERAMLFDTDPATSSAWTLSGVDGIEGGVIERQSTAGQATQLTAVYVNVDYTPSSASSVPVFYYHRTMQGLS